MKRNKIDYGIDLGTTNSAISRIENGVSKILEIENSKTLPSVVWFNRKDGHEVGVIAKNKYDSFKEFKRRMGRKNLDENNPHKLSDGRDITPEFLSSIVLSELKKRVFDEVFKSVVVTVPAMFEIGQTEATKRSAKMAGFDQVEVLMEPVAAAYAYASSQSLENGTWIVFDFGGGTFDSSLLKVEDGVMKVISSEGDTRLGGKDLDNALVNEILLPIIKSNHNINDFDENRLKKLKSKLLIASEKIKIKLTKSENFDFLSDLGEFGNDSDENEIEIEKVFSRDELNKIFQPFFQKAIDCTKKLMERNNMNISDISKLILVGGPTQIPFFRKMITEQLMQPDFSIDAMTSVSEGAALYASNINNLIEDHGKKIGSDNNETSIEAEKILVDYEATTKSLFEPVSIRKTSNKKLFASISSEDGSWKSPLQELDDVFECKINDGFNIYKIDVFDEMNNKVICDIKEINIKTSGLGEVETSLPYYMGLEVIDSKKKRKVFRAISGLEIDTPLPATGLTEPTGELYTTNEIRPGVKDDKINIKLYQSESNANNTRSILNKYSGLSFEINGDDVPKLIPSNSVVNFKLKIDKSQNCSLEIYFPNLDITISKDSIEIPAQKSNTINDVEELKNESDKLIKELSESLPIPENLNEIKNNYSGLNKDFSNISSDDDIDQLYSNFQKLLKIIDLALDDLQLPKLNQQIKKALADLESTVNECVEKNLKGHESDKSDLDMFKSNFDQLQKSPNVDLAQQLLDDINSKQYQIVDRHAGKEQSISFIRSINNNFNTIKWTNVMQAKNEVDKGISLVNNGASEHQLKDQLRNIVSYMVHPDDSFNNPGDIKI
jgi:molecular chaperone DnaK